MLRIDREFERLTWVHIRETSFLTKFFFKDYGYGIIITDLIYVYLEKLPRTCVHHRFKTMNPYVDMKPNIIMKNIGTTLGDYIYKHEGSVFVQKTYDSVNLQLKFDVNEVTSYYEMKLEKNPAEKFFKYVLGPMILNACISKRCLESKMVKEDYELPLDGYKTTTKNVKFDSTWLRTNEVPEYAIKESFLAVQGNLYELLSEDVFSGSDDEGDYGSSVTTAEPGSSSAANTSENREQNPDRAIKDTENSSSSVHFEEGNIAQSGSSSTANKVEDKEQNSDHSIQIEPEATCTITTRSRSQQEGKKIKKKKINI